MSGKFPIRYVLPVFALAALALLAWWFLHDPVKNFTASVPGMDNRKKGGAASKEAVKIGAEYKFFKAMDDLPGTSWPRFRGADFDNISKERTRLADHWGTGGPRILWKLTLGEGHAAPAVYHGKVYLLDYDEGSKTDQLRCFSLLTGEVFPFRPAKSCGAAGISSTSSATTAFPGPFPP
jgi:outer membrane protein assembly factor BamB